jgi:hypothetical protein
MDTISPDIAKKLLTRDFANLIQRVQRGGNLSRSERVALQCLAAAGSSGLKDTPAYAASFVELAALPGVARRTLQRWRKRKDAPKPAANGFHDVAAWREFMRRHDLKGDGIATEEERALSLRKLRAEAEERELRVAQKTNVGSAAILFRSKLEQELPPILSGLDASGVQAECRRAIDEVLTMLHLGSGGDR